jgi:hypothetical protein
MQPYLVRGRVFFFNRTCSGAKWCVLNLGARFCSRFVAPIRDLFQDHVLARGWGFNSPLRHHTRGSVYRALRLLHTEPLRQVVIFVNSGLLQTMYARYTRISPLMPPLHWSMLLANRLLSTLG